MYLNPASNGLELYQGIDTFAKRYNHRRHQGVERRKPVDLYLNAAKHKLRNRTQWPKHWGVLQNDIYLVRYRIISLTGKVYFFSKAYH